MSNNVATVAGAPMNIEKKELLPGDGAETRGHAVCPSAGLLCNVALFIMVLVMIATSNAIFAISIIILYVSVLYAWEKIFRKPWLFTEAERKKSFIVAGRMTFRRETIAKLVFGVYIFLAFTSTPLTQIVSLKIIGVEPNGYVTFSYNLLGSTLILLLAIFVVDCIDVARLAFLRVRKAEGAGTDNLGRIVEQRKSFGVGCCYVLFTILSLANGYDAGKTVRVDVFLKELPPCLDGFKVGVFSDVHAGPLIGKTEIARQVELMNKESPDIAILSGDMADGPTSDVGPALYPISRDLKTKFGIFFSTGNHEYLHGGSGADWEKFWKDEGVVPLHNNRTTVPGTPYNPSCNETFDLIGVPDLGHSPKLKEALSGTSSGRARVLIAHQPLQIEEAAKEKVSLQISGHTHAGHLFPLHIAIWLANRGYFAGLSRLDSTQVYISEGTVGWGPRTRLFSFNERTILTLRAGDKDATGDLYRPSAGIGVILSAFVVVLQLACCFVVVCLPGLRKVAKTGHAKYVQKKKARAEA